MSRLRTGSLVEEWRAGAGGCTNAVSASSCWKSAHIAKTALSAIRSFGEAGRQSAEPRAASARSFSLGLAGPAPLLAAHASHRQSLEAICVREL